MDLFLSKKHVGFKKLVRTGIQSNSAQTVSVDLILEPGDAGENVAINADVAVTDESNLR